MGKITLDYLNSLSFFNQDEIDSLEEKVEICHKMLHNATGKGYDNIGWVKLPDN
ncbi:MAG: hypothetical protein AB7V16_03800 [Vulcanibacillus sp.]